MSPAPFQNHPWLDTQAKIEAAIARATGVGGVVEVAPTTVTLTGSGAALTVPAGVVLRIPNGASLALDSAYNINAVALRPGAALEGDGKIDVSAVAAFNKVAVLLDAGAYGNYRYPNPTRVDGVHVTAGSVKTGAGVRLTASAATGGSGIEFVRSRGLIIEGFGIGLDLYAVNPTSGTNYVNGNLFEQLVVVYSKQGVALRGDVSGTSRPINSNHIEFQYQYDTTLADGVNALYGTGETNQIRMTVWDWTAAAAVTLATASKNNRVIVNLSAASVTDSGTTNTVVNLS